MNEELEEMLGMKSFTGLVALMAALLPSALSTVRGSELSYDPIIAAMEKLALYGMPVPNGSVVRAAQPGELGPDMLAHTDSDTGEITVDSQKLNNFAGNTDATTAEHVGIFAAVLYHEYQHTEDYGNPSVSGGYNNDFCQHQDTYKGECEFICEMVEDIKTAGGPVESLCRFQQTQADQWNSLIDDYISHHCPGYGSAEKIKACNACY